MVSKDKAVFLRMKNSERAFYNTKKPNLDISSKEKLLHMRNVEQLLHESDKSTARYQTLEIVRSGEHSIVSMIDEPEIYAYLPLVKTCDFTGAVLNISSQDAQQLLKDKCIYTIETEIGRLSLNERTKLKVALKEAISD